MTPASDANPRVSVVEFQAFDGSVTEVWARFVLLPDGIIRIVGNTPNAAKVADEMTARGVPGPHDTIVRRDRGLEFLRLLAENFRGSREYATKVFEMDQADALVLGASPA